MLLNYVQDIYGANYFITDVPAESLTHLIYAFANVNTTTGSVYGHIHAISENRPS
jgi:GH18 family chitinase